MQKHKENIQLLSKCKGSEIETVIKSFAMFSLRVVNANNSSFLQFTMMFDDDLAAVMIEFVFISSSRLPMVMHVLTFYVFNQVAYVTQ